MGVRGRKVPARFRRRAQHPRAHPAHPPPTFLCSAALVRSFGRMVARDVNRRHVAWGPLLVVVVAAVAITALVAVVDAEPSIPGGAGYALLFSDNIATVAPFHDMPTTELTFEAWLRTSDGCHTGAVVSYAEKTTSKDASERVKAANSFVVWDIKDLLA